MEIYKLSDEISEDKKESGFCDAKNDELKITDIKQAVKNENRVNVFVNGKYSFSLDIAQAVELKIKVGLLISAEKLAEYKKASEFGKLYQRALEWCLTRPRSERELRDYLYRKLQNNYREHSLNQKTEYSFSGRSSRPSLRGSSHSASQGANGSRSNCETPSKEYIRLLSDQVTQLLIEKSYVDDRKFTEYYVENRFVKKGISKRRLTQELMKKGVAKEIIDEFLDARNDEEEILKMINKKRTKYDDEKLISYLCRQGFDYQQVQNLVRTYEKD